MWTANARDAGRRRLRALNTTCARHDARRLTRTILPMCGGVRDRTVRTGSPVRATAVLGQVAVGAVDVDESTRARRVANRQASPGQPGDSLEDASRSVSGHEPN